MLTETGVDCAVDLAATLLSVVGSKRFIYKHSLLMIHGLKFSNENIVSDLNELNDINYNTNLMLSIIKDIYHENTKLEENDFIALGQGVGHKVVKIDPSSPKYELLQEQFGDINLNDVVLRFEEGEGVFWIPQSPPELQDFFESKGSENGWGTKIYSSESLIFED